MRFFLLLSFTILLCASASGDVVVDTLYINRGVFVTVNQSQFPALSYNKTVAFEANSQVFQLTTSDTLLLTVINNDTTAHGFRVDALNQQVILAPGDTGFLALHFSQQGAFIYRDPLNSPFNAYLGLTGLIAVDNHVSSKNYYWNIRAHHKQFNEMLASNQSVNWNQYAPDYFTINGKSFPDLQLDTTAVINALVGDTIHIFIANTGRSKHSIHFHGFHTTSIYNDNGILTGASKDTWPVRGMEAMVLRLVPDKPGLYSVHDHNLVAVSGGGTHPNGMLLIMNIQP